MRTGVAIELYADFACPYCFLADCVLKQAIAGKDVNIDWMPFELRPYTVSSHSTEQTWSNL